MELHVPDFFNRGPSPGARFALFASLSLALLVLDAYKGTMAPVRTSLATVIMPVQQTALLPSKVIHIISAYLADQKKTLAENEALQQKVLKQGAELMRLAALENENRELRSLATLQAKTSIAPIRNGLVAEIISTDRDQFNKRVLINRGLNDKVEVGQIAIDANGVIGQVTRVLPASSELTLITDQKQLIPIQIQRTGLRAIAYGLGRDEGLEVRFISVNTDIKPGDVLLTSGLDGIYPTGLPVATVVRVDRGGALNFAHITAQPTGAAERFRQLLLLPVEKH